MLPETKAILFNIFRDYLSTDEQKEKIKRMQKEDIERLKQEKLRKSFESKNKFEEKNTISIDENIGLDSEEKMIVKVEKGNFIKRIIKKIKSIFHLK